MEHFLRPDIFWGKKSFFLKILKHIFEIFSHETLTSLPPKYHKKIFSLFQAGLPHFEDVFFKKNIQIYWKPSTKVSN